MSIPASRIVAVTPEVLSAGGASLSLNGLFLTESSLMPTGQVYAFQSQPAVAAFFGANSTEASVATKYFAGYDNSPAKPNAMLFAAYNNTARSAFLQSGSLVGMTLAQLQALSGTLTVTLDGTPETSSSINLSSATSFSDAASKIATAFTAGPLVTWNAQNNTFTLTSHTTGANSSLTYATGTLSEGLKLASDDSGILSQGAPVDTPATAMANVVRASQNWVSMVTLFEPQLADKEGFATWFNGQNNRFVYLAWDTDAQAIVPNSTEPFGVVALNLDYNGVCVIGGDPAAAIAAGTSFSSMLLNTAAFVAGAIASIDFSATNGRITLAGRTQSGLIPTCTDDTNSQTLLANGYNFYGAYATAASNFNMFQNGQIPGEFDWLDSFIDQVFLNSQFQLALITLIQQTGAINYTPAGYGLIRAAMLDIVNDAINFGSIVSGVTLSDAEKSEINQAAGVDAASQIGNYGFYLQVKDPGTAARAERKTPIINFWYTDGGAVQQISLASIAVQ